MKAEILSIGSELTSGQNLDTNGQWLSLRLEEIGIPVGWHTTIADDLHANLEAFQIATQRAVLVVATGGLGPTQDDLTREVLARVAGVELVFDAESLARIETLFKSRRRTMPEMDMASASCAIQNFWLAARAEGIGVGWVSMFDPAHLRTLCQMPEGSQPIALLCVGQVEAFYPAPMLETEGWDQRRALQELIYENSWGNVRPVDPIR